MFTQIAFNNLTESIVIDSLALTVIVWSVMWFEGWMENGLAMSSNRVGCQKQQTTEAAQPLCFSYVRYTLLLQLSLE